MDWLPEQNGHLNATLRTGFAEVSEQRQEEVPVSQVERVCNVLEELLAKALHDTESQQPYIEFHPGSE